MRLPPLNSLKAFEVAARRGGFVAAAEELNVTPAAVSHQVKTLESYLDIELFRRLPRGLELTESGRELLPELSRGFDHFAGVDWLEEMLRAEIAVAEMNAKLDGLRNGIADALHALHDVRC